MRKLLIQATQVRQPGFATFSGATSRMVSRDLAGSPNHRDDQRDNQQESNTQNRSLKDVRPSHGPHSPQELVTKDDEASPMTPTSYGIAPPVTPSKACPSAISCESKKFTRVKAKIRADR